MKRPSHSPIINVNHPEPSKTGLLSMWLYLFQIFLTLMSRSPPTEGGTLSDGVRLYLQKVVELTYLMCIQEPPMILEWVRLGDSLDPEKFKPYTEAGSKIVGTIWPAVLLYENGQVMSRGIVDVMRKQTHGARTFNRN